MRGIWTQVRHDTTTNTCYGKHYGSPQQILLFRRVVNGIRRPNSPSGAVTLRLFIVATRGIGTGATVNLNQVY